MLKLFFMVICFKTLINSFENVLKHYSLDVLFICAFPKHGAFSRLIKVGTPVFKFSAFFAEIVPNLRKPWPVERVEPPWN